jgi:hypothetical protein
MVLTINQKNANKTFLLYRCELYNYLLYKILSQKRFKSLDPKETRLVVGPDS